jgi:hypothetical protein
MFSLFVLLIQSPRERGKEEMKYHSQSVQSSPSPGFPDDFPSPVVEDTIGSSFGEGEEAAGAAGAGAVRGMGRLSVSDSSDDELGGVRSEIGSKAGCVDSRKQSLSCSVGDGVASGSDAAGIASTLAFARDSVGFSEVVSSIQRRQESVGYLPNTSQLRKEKEIPTILKLVNIPSQVICCLL